MNTYKNKYRIDSTRAQWWDYGWSGAYFITICTKNREHFFGRIADGKMDSSDMGNIALTLLLKISHHFPIVKLGPHIIMPNHVHIILTLDKIDQKIIGQKNDEAATKSNQKHLNKSCIEERFISSLHKNKQKSSPKENHTTFIPGGATGYKNPMLNNNISRMIRWYKGRCTFEIRKKHPDFAWQPRFYDHIIRNDSEYHRISTYIKHNPTNWKDDAFYSS